MEVIIMKSRRMGVSHQYYAGVDPIPRPRDRITGRYIKVTKVNWTSMPIGNYTINLKEYPKYDK